MDGWYNWTSLNTGDYPEPPAMTLEEQYMRMHRDKDEDEEDEEDADL